jgi:hypothetical protein
LLHHVAPAIRSNFGTAVEIGNPVLHGQYACPLQVDFVDSVIIFTPFCNLFSDYCVSHARRRVI